MDAVIIERLARLAHLDLGEAERTQLEAQLATILNHFERLQELPTQGVDPAVYAVDLPGATRPDEARSSGMQAAILKNAPQDDGACFLVPRTLE